MTPRLGGEKDPDQERDIGQKTVEGGLREKVGELVGAGGEMEEYLNHRKAVLLVRHFKGATWCFDRFLHVHNLSDGVSSFVE